MRPPRLAHWLLERLLSESAAEAIGGDLIEEFHRIAARRGARYARRWFWRHAAASVFFRGRAAVSPRRTAKVALGPEDHPTGRTNFMSSAYQDLRFALRVLLKSPGFTATAVVTLAFGIAGTTTIVTAASWAWLRPLPYSAPEALVHVGEANDDGTVGNVGFETILDWRARVDGFDAVLPIRSWQPTLVGDSGAERLDGVRVGWEYFGMLGVRPALGRDFEATDDRPAGWRVVIISHGLWQRRFSSRPDIVGSSVSFNGSDYQVVGVLPASFEALISERFYTRADVWAPLGYAVGDSFACRTCRHLRAIGRVRSGSSVDSIRAELAVAQDALRRDFPSEYDQSPAIAVPLATQLSGRFERPLQVLMGAVALLMFITCANVAGLLIARSTDRAREISVRAALGASRRRIARQLLTESVLVAGAATGLGLGLAKVGLIALAGTAPAGLPRLDQALGDPAVWVVAATVGTVSLILFGVFPSLKAARIDLQSALRGTGHSPDRTTVRTREVMIVGQIAVALILLVGSGLMLRTVNRLLAVDPGFQPESVWTAQFSLVGPAWAEDSAVYAFQEALLERVQALPGVEAVGMTGLLPLGGSYDRRGFGVEGHTYETPDDTPSAERYSVSPGYFDAMQLTLRAGRWFGVEDTTASDRVALVNDTAASRLWPGENPVGKRLSFDATATPSWITIVGVVGDVRHYDLETPPIMQIYVPQSQSTDSFLALVARAPGGFEDLDALIRREVAALALDVPVYDAAPFTDLMTRALGARAFLMTVLGLFASVSVLLAVVGLYGVVSQVVAAREREIGIRVSLGARRTEIAQLVLGRGLAMVGVGLALGMAAAAGVSGVLEAQLFETAGVDPLTYLVAGGGLFLGAMAAHVVPLRRAVRLDAGRILRAD